MTLLDLMMSWDHLSMRDAATVERWRAKWADETIMHAAMYPRDQRRHDGTPGAWAAVAASGLGAERIIGYLGRNPRPERPKTA